MSSTTAIESPEQLLVSTYPRLRWMAAHYMRGEAPGQTISPTALVHEAWLRLSSSSETKTWWRDRRKLVAAVATAMRRTLIDRARRRLELKRGGKLVRVPMEDANHIPADVDEKLLLIHEALLQLESENRDYARVVTLKIFGGFSMEEIAAEMGVTVRTVHRYWARAKVRLYQEMVASP